MCSGGAASNIYGLYIYGCANCEYSCSVRALRLRMLIFILLYSGFSDLIGVYSAQQMLYILRKTTYIFGCEFARSHFGKCPIKRDIFVIGVKMVLKKTYLLFVYIRTLRIAKLREARLRSATAPH